mmetsp:Transcript_408/g.590  ORF Transcript_408/g.590 Transcript_408/m.590 type:complete len:894 (-) Transcript_408:195-2876(-)
MTTTSDVRLPINVTPKLYEVELEALTDLKDFTFKGKLAVHVSVKESSVKTITCHSADIKIDAKDVEYKPAAGGSLPATAVTFDEKQERVSFEFANALPKGEGVLEVKSYLGELNNKMKGFYRSKYAVDGKEKYMAVTQFEATDARRCLPCWDEPAVKAEFVSTVIAPKKETAISNMPVVSGYPKPHPDNADLFIWKFEKSPIMSTYLLAFVVGEFDHIETKSKAADFKDGKATGDVAIRVYAPRGKTDQAKFALEVASKCLTYFTQFFEIGYPLPKLDLIAIPDFSSGAMENWGCVTYRTVCLLVDEKNTSLKNKQFVAIVVAHELAHQWFGNLVTMEWWTELWLNEGFASWVEYLAVDVLFPEWKVWESFVNDAHNPALGLDSLLTSHPIEVVVKNPSEIDEIFDTISYLKGASVIRMLANHLGTETFRKGLVAYLNEFKYKNARTTDLWRWIEIGGKLPKDSIKSLMTNWTGKLGYPVLSVEETKGGFAVSQQHFVSSGEKGEPTVWEIPVNIDLYSESGSSQIKHLMKEAKDTIEVESKYSAAIFNQGSQSYFIVNYGPKIFEKVKKAIEDASVKSPVDRLAIQNDLMSLVKAGVDANTSSKEYFELLKAYKNETEYIVWESILANLSKLSVLAKAAGFVDAFSKYMIEILTPIATKLGWEPKEGEPATDKMLRAQVIPLIGAYGHEETVKQALKLFDEFYAGKQYKEEFKGTSALSPDFRSGVFRIAVKARGKSAYDQLVHIYKATTLQEEKTRVLRAFGASEDEDLIKRTLALAMDFDFTRKQDFMYPIFGAVGTDKGLRMSWAFIKENWPKILKEFKGTHMLVRLASITSRFAKEADMKDVAEFFKANEHPGAERKVKQCLESISTNAKWLTRDEKAIAKAVGANSK